MKTIKFKTNRLNTHSRKYDSIAALHYPPDTIPLWVADMDIEVDQRIIQGLHAYIDEKVLGYNLEHESYRTSIKHFLQRRHGLEIETDWILTTYNVVSSINACLLALTKPGDKILILEPVYSPFFKSIEATGRQVVFSALKHVPWGYVMDFDDIASKCETNTIAMFIMCSPHNPVGRVWRMEELQQLLHIMHKHRILVVSDEIHMDIVFKGHRHVPLLSLDTDVIMLMSASKTFNLASAHVSQIIVKNPQLRHALAKCYHQLGLFHHVELGLRATTLAFQACDDYIDELCGVIEDHVNLIKAMMRDTKIKVIPMEGTYLVWLDVRAYGLSSQLMQERLIHEAKVWLLSGTVFGPSGEGYLRLNCATSMETLTEACIRITTWLKEMDV